MLETIAGVELLTSCEDRAPVGQLLLTLPNGLTLEVGLSGLARLVSSCCGDSFTTNNFDRLVCWTCHGLSPLEERADVYLYSHPEELDEEGVEQLFAVGGDPLAAILAAPQFLREVQALLRLTREHFNHPIPKARLRQGKVRVREFERREQELWSTACKPNFLEDFAPLKKVRYLP